MKTSSAMRRFNSEEAALAQDHSRIRAKPAVLIPLPFSFADEQRQNAEKLFSVGLAKVIEQKELTPEK